MISKNRLRRKNRFEEEDVSPMEGAINIVDAMLVFACGLILSLVIFWNVDIGASNPVTIEKETSISKENIKTSENSKESNSKKYAKLGEVYENPETGELYMVKDSNKDEK